MTLPLQQGALLLLLVLLQLALALLHHDLTKVVVLTPIETPELALWGGVVFLLPLLLIQPFS